MARMMQINGGTRLLWLRSRRDSMLKIDSERSLRMNSKLGLLCSIAALLGLLGCGGGNTGAASATSASVTVAELPASFLCDESAAFEKAEKIVVDSTQLEVQFPRTQTVAFETWPVRIDGSVFRLNVRISTPKPGTLIRGVWLYAHGIANYSAIPRENMDFDSVHESRATSLGYITMSVARRGNFGSDGAPGSPNYSTYLAQYRSRQISYSQFDDLLWGYHADSVIAAIDYMKTDARIAPYLDTIVLTGFSGGAETLLYAAAKSPIFAAARSKAMIRGAGRDSAFDTNPEAALGNNESMARLASTPGMVPALWYAGTVDPITSAGKLACAFGFYNSANGIGSKLAFLSGMGHGGAQMSSAAFQNTVTGYLRSRSMPGF